MKIGRVLVALDGSPEAEVALAKTVELAGQHAGTQIMLVRAVDPTALGDGDRETGVNAIGEATEYLRDVAERLHREGLRPVARSVWVTGPEYAISAVARRLKPDLIVMASRHRDESGRPVPGPIAEFVRDRTGLPVVLVAAGDSALTPRSQDTTAASELVHARA